MEAKTQKRLIEYLKKKGFYVIKTRPGLGTPTGCPDVVALYKNFWAAFEVKASESSPFRPLQKENIEIFNDWSFARAIYPENFEEVISELEAIL